MSAGRFNAPRGCSANWSTPATRWPTFTTPTVEEDLRRLAKDRTLAQLALQFVMAHPAVTVAIPGAKMVRQLKDNVGAALLPPLAAEETA